MSSCFFKRRGRGYNYSVFDQKPETLVVTKRSIFRNFRRYLRQHSIYLKRFSEGSITDGKLSDNDEEEENLEKVFIEPALTLYPEMTRALIPRLRKKFADLI